MPATAAPERGRATAGKARQTIAWPTALLAAWLLGSAPWASGQSVEAPAERPAIGVARDRNAIKLQADAIDSIRTLLDTERTSEALQVAEKALRQFPGNVQMRFLYGVALSDSGETDQAIQVFSELTQSHPELAEPYNNLAVLYASSGNLEGARNALEEAIVAVPDYSLAAENLGDLYIRLAVQAYDKGVVNRNAGASIRRKLVQARTLLDQIEAEPPARTR